MFSPHIDCGDHIVITNADKVKLTGNKLKKKIYYRHTGYPGGIKERTAGQIMAGAHPERVILKAVERMMPRGSMGRQQFKNLRVYAGPEHPHEAQAPQKLDVSAMNPKNKRSALNGG
jgi:large subunit ribosomal protein L13